MSTAMNGQCVVIGTFKGVNDDVITDWDISIHSDAERDEDEEVELIEEDIKENDDE